MPLVLLLAVQVQEPDVVVTADRLDEAYAACRRGGCSPLQDARTSIKWAEARFRQGAYVDAKKALSAALARNGKHASTAPKPLSALYAAYATVSWHEGDQDAYQRAAVRRARLARAHLPPADIDALSALMGMGDMWARLRRPDLALQSYREVETRALAAGRTGAAVRAMLTRAWLQRLRNKPAEAKSLLASAQALAAKGDEIAQGSVNAMRLRLAVVDGAPAEIAAARAAFGGAAATRPILIEQPPYPVVDPVSLARRADERQGVLGDGANGAAFGRTASGSVVRWADIGFWVRPDGGTAEAAVLRGSRDGRWAESMLGQVAGRRYRPLALPAGSPGIYRIERLSYRPNYATPLGSRIRRRMGAYQLETLDLTEPGARAQPIEARTAG